jgi:hypothetical protein
MKVELLIKTYKHFFPLVNTKETMIEDKILAANFFKP